MDEVFGENAFVASVVWQKKTTRDSRAAFSSNHDTILVYAPSGPKKWKTSRNLLVKDDAHMQNRDDDPRGPWTDAPFTAPGYRKAQQYDIVTPTGQVLRPPRGRSWYATEQTYIDLIADGRIWFPKGGDGSPRLKLFAHQIRGLVPFTVWGATDTGTNDDAKRHLVVDIFGGSGTTAAVAHKMRRRWVAVERNAQTVLDFLLPRLQRIVDGCDPGGVTEAMSWVGGGSFEMVHVPPRFGKLTGMCRSEAIKRHLEMLAETRALSLPRRDRSAAA
jgi:adenine-specific DNA-methyltransferase